MIFPFDHCAKALTIGQISDMKTAAHREPPGWLTPFYGMRSSSGLNFVTFEIWVGSGAFASNKLLKENSDAFANNIP
jgi:hypothetical protein